MASVLESFSAGFRLTSRHFDVLVLPTLVLFFIQFVLLMYDDMIALAANPLPLVLLAITLGFLAAAAQVWLYSTALSYVTRRKHAFRWSASLALFAYLMIVSLMAHAISYLFGIVLFLSTASIVLFYTLLLAWPALLIFLLVRFVTFIPEIASDSRESGAFERTWQLTSGHFWQVVRFMLLSVLVLLAGFAALGVGVLFAFPMTVLASVHFYEQLRKESKKHRM